MRNNAKIRFYKKSMSKTTKITIWLIIIIVVIAGIWWGVARKPAQPPIAKKEVVKIGVILPLSGTAAYAGEEVKSGIDLAVEEINNKGGINGKKLEVIYEDTKCNPTEAINVFNKLTKIDKISVIIGDWCSSCVLAVAPIAEKSRIVLVSLGISPKIRFAGDYIFRIPVSLAYYSKRLAQYVHKKNISKVSILYINNDYGASFSDYFRKDFENLGGKIVSVETFERGATDFRTQLIKIKNDNSEAIFIIAYNEFDRILKQKEELKINKLVLASNTVESQQVLDLGKLAEGIIYPYSFNPDSNRKGSIEYQTLYKAKYGKKSGYYAAEGYDAVKILAKAIKVCGTNSVCIKNELYKIKNFDGATGKISIDEYGDVETPILIKKIENQNFIIIEE